MPKGNADYQSSCIDMDDQTKLSRGQFLAILGGMALTVALLKFSSVKHAITAAGTAARPARVTYGNGAYGGKKA
jgi:hypothetical protein